MSATTANSNTIKAAKLAKWKEGFDRISKAVSDSVEEFFVTLFTSAMLDIFIFNITPGQLAARVIALTTVIYIILLLIQIVHKFDNHWTVDELADAMMFDMNEIKETLGRIERNDDHNIREYDDRVDAPHE